jgi:hypothetical protein
MHPRTGVVRDRANLINRVAGAAVDVADLKA